MRVKITAETQERMEFPIGRYSHGIALEGGRIIDMALNETVLTLKDNGCWAGISDAHEFPRIFIQGVPE